MMRAVLLAAALASPSPAPIASTSPAIQLPIGWTRLSTAAFRSPYVRVKLVALAPTTEEFHRATLVFIGRVSRLASAQVPKLRGPFIEGFFHKFPGTPVSTVKSTIPCSTKVRADIVDFTAHLRGRDGVGTAYFVRGAGQPIFIAMAYGYSAPPPAADITQMLAWFCPLVNAGSAMPIPNPSPASSPIASAALASPTPIATAPVATPAAGATPAAAASPQATMQPISAFMQVPKGWRLDRRVRVLSALTQIRFQAVKAYAGGVESINVTESNGPHAGTLSDGVTQALGLLKHFGTKFHLISSRSSFVCAGTRPAWRLHYRIDLGAMHLLTFQYIAMSPHGSFGAATYMRTAGNAADPEALAALGTFCPQDFVAPPAIPVINVMPGLRAPLPVGWTLAGSGIGMTPGSHVLASASKKLAGGTSESYLTTAVSLRQFGDVTGKPIPLETVAQFVTKGLLAMFPGSTVVSSAKVAGCGGSESQWQFEVRTPMSFLIERIAQRNGQLVADVYARPIAMLQPDPAAQTAIDALCLTPSVASIMNP